MAAEYGQHGASQNGGQVADPDLLKRQAIEVISKLVEVKYKSLHDEFKQDLKSYPDEGIEFVFHNACKHESPEETELDFIEEVIEECLKLKGIAETKLKAIERCEVLEHLFNLPNSDGYTPFHVAIENHEEFYLTKFLKRVEASPALAFSILVNAPDLNEWSPIHKILTRKQGSLPYTGFAPMLEVLKLVKEKIDWSAVLPGSNATALHLAIYHGNPVLLDTILKCESSDGKSMDVALNTMMERSIVYGRRHKPGVKRSSKYWSPLQLAAVMGDPLIVGPLIKKIDNIYDSSKLKNDGLSKPKDYDEAIPALHLAATSGEAELIRLFKPTVFNLFMLTSHIRTSIHFATDCTIPRFNEEEKKDVNIRTDFPKFRDPFGIGEYVDGYGRRLRSTAPTYNHEGWQACVTVLLQAGVNMWQKDKDDRLAGPGSKAPAKLRLWWYDTRAKDALASRKNLNDAANAISVVAALVATASYVGPLQPPLGYGTSDPSVQDLVQTTKFLIRLFVVSNCLSFYLAIGSILFAVVPSLPRPHLNVDCMDEEWQRMKRTVCIAILFLLLAIVGVLISFAAASNVGMEDHYSWHHSGLSFYPTILGSLICLYGIITFFVRLLRLVFDKNMSIRHWRKKRSPL